MAGHARFAPSGAHRWIACPGSIRLSENIEYTASEYAMEGTALHEITEQCLREKLYPKQFVGMSLKSPKDDPSWSMEMDEGHAEAVQYCIDEVKRIMTEYGIKGGKLEIRVNLTDDCWGTVDVLLWNEEWLIVIDFKFGRGKSVEAKGNAQQMIYSIGGLKHLHDEGIPLPEKVKLIIIQPRIPNPTREWDTTREELQTWYVKSVKPAFDAALEDEPVFNPGEEQCQFCPANGVCAARADFLLGIAEYEFAKFTLPGSDLPAVPKVRSLASDIRGDLETKMDTALAQLTPEIAGKILKYQPDFDNFFNSIGDYALKEALRGNRIPGYKLVHGRSNRKWAESDADIRKLLRDDFEIDPDAKPKLLSPAQAEKKIGKARKEELGEYIIKPKGKIILVDENDTREEVSVAAEEDMKEFADTVPGNSPNDVDVFDEDGFFTENPLPDEEVVADKEKSGDTILVGTGSTIPSKRTKKHKIMEIGLKGNASIKEVADLMFKGDEGYVHRGLQQLHERDGFTVIYHDETKFTVKEV